MSLKRAVEYFIETLVVDGLEGPELGISPNLPEGPFGRLQFSLDAVECQYNVLQATFETGELAKCTLAFALHEDIVPEATGLYFRAVELAEAVKSKIISNTFEGLYQLDDDRGSRVEVAGYRLDAQRDNPVAIVALTIHLSQYT